MDFIKFCSSIKESYSVGVHNLTRYYKTEDSLMELSWSTFIVQLKVAYQDSVFVFHSHPRFYNACSLSDILSQLRNTKTDDGSVSGSLDMLVDLDSGLSDTQSTLTISITVDSVRLDSNSRNNVSSTDLNLHVYDIICKIKEN